MTAENLPRIFQLDLLEEKDFVRMLSRQAGKHFTVEKLRLFGDARKIRHLVEHLRKEHHCPICSHPDRGYWWPASWQDCDHTLAYLKDMIGNLLDSYNGIIRGRARLYSPQMELEMEVENASR